MPTPYVMPFHVKHAVAGVLAWSVLTLPEVFIAGDFYAGVGDFFPVQWLVAGNLIVILVYVLALQLMGEFSWREVQMLRDLAHPGALARDIKRDLAGEETVENERTR